MKTTLSIELIPIEDDGFHLKIEIKINGNKASMILDTGASRSVFDQNRVTNFVDEEELEDQERLSSGLGTTNMASQKVVFKQLIIGDIELKDYHAAVIDLSHINQSYENLDIDEIDGVLGSDILNDYNAVIDYKKKQLILST